jgi:hypothetical protein
LIGLAIGGGALIGAAITIAAVLMRRRQSVYVR